MIIKWPDSIGEPRAENHEVIIYSRGSSGIFIVLLEPTESFFVETNFLAAFWDLKRELEI